MTKSLVFAMALSLALGVAVNAQFDSGSDSSDGDFNPGVNTTINLGLADTGPGTGHFDTDLWVIVFNYGTINIPSNVTVSFTPHSSGAPVVWLAAGNVTITGVVDLNGNNGLGTSTGASRLYARPGAGGFWGGVGGTHTGVGGMWPAGGLGPGGATVDPDGDAGGTGGGYGSLGSTGAGGANFQNFTYGNQFIFPLIGGSGGAGGWGNNVSFGGNGGGGGGGILIASSGVITLPPTTNVIRANGGAGGAGSGGFNGQIDGGGGGSGGAIRLMANSISGPGTLSAVGGGGGGTGGGNAQGGGAGGNGRIRVEADFIELNHPGSPNWTSANMPGLVFQPANWPKLRSTMVNAEAVPSEPDYDPSTPEVVLNDLVNPATLQIAGNNIPTGTPVEVHVVTRNGTSSISSTFLSAGPLVGTFASSTTSALVNFPVGLSEVQLRANWAARAEWNTGGSDPHAGNIQQETLPRYRQVHAIVGIEVGPGPDEITYITGNGRRVTYPVGLIESGSSVLDRIKSSR